MTQTLETPIKVSETCTVPPGGFSVILLDPPWHYRDKLDHDDMRGAAEDHYPVLKPKHLANIAPEKIAADDCALFLWVTAPQMDVVIRLIDAWADRQRQNGVPKYARWQYKTVAFVWRKMYKNGKPQFGLGRWTRSTYEYVLLVTRGKPKRIDKGIRQEIQAVVGRHSAKPRRVRKRIVRLMGDVPRVELFARDRANGWEATGLDLDGVDIRDTILYVPQTEPKRD